MLSAKTGRPFWFQAISVQSFNDHEANMTEISVARHSKECTEFALKMYRIRDFPGGTVVKNPPANAGDMGSIPLLGRSHMLLSN